MITIYRILISVVIMLIASVSFSLNKNQKAPDFALKDQNGKTVKLSDFRGKYVHLDFSATWCGPCHMQAAYLGKVEKELRKYPFVSITILTDARGNRETLKKWANKYKLHYVLDGPRNLSSKYGVSGIPHNVIIRPDGTVAKFWAGAPANKERFIVNVKNAVPQMFSATKITTKSKTKNTANSSGKTAINFTLKNQNGKKVSLSDFKGKYIHLDFSATWCRPCHKQASYMGVIDKALKKYNYVSITILTDGSKKGRPYLKKWAKHYGLHNVLQGNGSVARQYAVNSVPHNIIIKPDFSIAGYWKGAFPKPEHFLEKLGQLVPEMFNTNNASPKETVSRPEKRTDNLPKTGKWKQNYYDKFSHSTFQKYKPAQQKINFRKIDYPLVQAAIFYETNRRRSLASRGRLSPFKYSHFCKKAAQLHANDMVQKNFFSHQSPIRGRATPKARLRVFKSRANGIGENIATAFGLVYKAGTMVSSFRDLPPHSYISFARDLVDGWMNSSGHRANILRNSFTHLGTGATPYQEKNGMIKFKCVQVFASSGN